MCFPEDHNNGSSDPELKSQKLYTKVSPFFKKFPYVRYFIVVTTKKKLANILCLEMAGVLLVMSHGPKLFPISRLIKMDEMDSPLTERSCGESTQNDDEQIFWRQ